MVSLMVSLMLDLIFNGYLINIMVHLSVNVMDNANTTLQMIAEGKLNLNALNTKNFEVEELKMKNLRNNVVIVFLGIVIGAFIVF